MPIRTPMPVHDDVPVMVFEGKLEEVAFLVSLLESGGITTNMVRAGRFTPARIYVMARDAADAGDLVAHFKAGRDQGTEH